MGYVVSRAGGEAFIAGRDTCNEQRGCVHPGIVKIAGQRQAPGHDLLRSIKLQRRVTTATPFGARDGHEVKEPRERFELTA